MQMDLNNSNKIIYLLLLTMEPDKLMIVAHPDDEILWGGANIVASRGWKIIVATNKRHKLRSLEFYRMAIDAGILVAEMYNCKDTEDDNDVFSGTIFEKALERESKKKWSLVLTHNELGEYGHPQHKRVYHLVKKHFPDAKFFKIGSKLNTKLISEKRQLCKNYPSQTITKLFSSNQDKEILENTTLYFTHETLYVKPEKWIIPKIAHQIWIGSDLPDYKKYFVKSIKTNLKGWDHVLWKTKDITREQFPNTFEYIEKAKIAGEDIGVSKWAQIADLMRYELLRRYGGVYFDSNMELFKDLTHIINTENKRGTRFIGANEEPCGLNCSEPGGIKFLSNGFFASIPRGEVLTKATSKEMLDSIDFNSYWVNRQTGPYYLRKAIVHPIKWKVRLLNTYDIYPFVANDGIVEIDGIYREKEQNKCIFKDEEEGTTEIELRDGTIVYLIYPCNKYPNALMMNHFIGGTWDWS